MILVHGMGATRAEAIRLLHETASFGLPSLVITYRNDPGAPGSPDGLLHLGMTEWKDLERAVEYSRRAGARDVILVGYSTGGALIARFLLSSTLAESVRGVILESPVLDWHAATAHYARHHRIPAPLATLGTQIAGWRAGIQWAGLEPLAHAKELRAPMLVIHGTADPVVPLWTSESLATRRPDLVTLIKIPGAGHVESWNADSTAYGKNVREWLQRVGLEPTVSP
ncbi:MAG TPA: alpha/beta fold hydrolase [Candidatus Eisenbacteria bacterium]|nr:alpha/beta fold hydrolase [Candidatus Eisenbacteria bacterium]